MRTRSRLDRLARVLGPGPRIAAAVVEEATGRVVQVLRGNQGFEPAPPGLRASELPRDCQVYLFDPEVSLLGCVDSRTGVAAVTVVRGIDLDVLIGKKHGPPRAAVGARPQGDP
jgi:hypothetical protein